MTSFRVPIFDDENRAIGFALLISLALHLVLLVMLPSIREALQRRSEQADPIVARLVEPPAKRVAEAAPAVSPVEPAKPAAKQVEPAKPPPQAALKRPQAPRASAAPVAPEVPARSEPVPARAEPAQAEAAAPASPAPSAGIVAAEPQVQPAPPVSVGVDAGTLAQYRLSIISAARRLKRYPRVALDQNWQGRVEVHMVIAPNGEISALNVRSSTGYTVLDEHALEMIERAKAIVQVPPALRGREFTVDVPVIFSLREAGG